MYLASRSASPNDEGKIMASDATERKGREGEDRNWSCNNGKVEEERKGERERGRRYGERRGVMRCCDAYRKWGSKEIDMRSADGRGLTEREPFPTIELFARCLSDNST